MFCYTCEANVLKHRLYCKRYNARWQKRKNDKFYIAPFCLHSAHVTLSNAYNISISMERQRVQCHDHTFLFSVLFMMNSK